MAHSELCPCPNCAGGTEGGGGLRQLLMVPVMFVGAMIMIAVVVKVAEVVWPYVVGTVLSAGTAWLGYRIWRFRHRRAVAARCIPAPDYAALERMPTRTMVTGVTVGQPIGQPARRELWPSSSRVRARR